MIRAETRGDAPLPVLFALNSAAVGGGNRVVLGLLDHLSRAVWRPIALVPGTGGMHEALRHRGVEVLRLDTVGPLRARSRTRIARALMALAIRLAGRGIRVLHAQGPLSYRLPSVVLRRARRVCHLHQALDDGVAWSFRRPPHALLACSQAVARDSRRAFASAGIDPPPFVTLPNAVDLDFWAAAPSERPPLPEHDGLVLFCGSLARGKGVEDFVRLAGVLAARRPGVLWVVAGDDLEGGGYRRHLERLAGASPAAGRILFTGHVEDPRPWFQACDLVALPSRSEGMPLALLEAAACGKPSVAFDIPGVDEILTDGVEGRRVPLGDQRGLTAAVDELLAHPERARAMGIRGRLRVERDHSLARSSARLAAIYEHLLEGLAPEPAAPRAPAPAPGRPDAGHPPHEPPRTKGWHLRYRDPAVVARYLEDRFQSPLGAVVHARQAAAVASAIRSLAPGRTLEVAAGPARFAAELARCDGSVAILDASLAMLVTAGDRLRHPASRVQADALALPFAPGTFDLLLCFRYLRHLEDPAERQRAAAELARVLRPGGRLLLDAINAACAARAPADARIAGPLPDVAYGEEQLRTELTQAGLRLEALAPVGRSYWWLRRMQILLAPRAPRLARRWIDLVERGGGEPLEWVATCRRI